MHSPSSHQRYRRVEQIWGNLALQHFLTVDRLQWMGAVRIRIQTAAKNITIIQNTSPAVNVLWSEKLCGCNKHIIRLNILQTQFLTLKDVNLMLMLSVWTHFDGTHSLQKSTFCIPINISFPPPSWTWLHQNKTVSDVEKVD